MTPQPVLTSIGQELYDAVAPLAYADELHGWALAYYCDAIGKMIDTIAGWARDTDADDPGWSVLLDLDRAPAEALPWLAQFIGVTTKPGLSDMEQRDRIRRADGFNRGTADSVRASAEPTLTGTKRVVFRERYDPATPLLDKPYHLTIRTLTFETPDPAATEAAILEQKPAGLLLHYSATPGQDYQTLKTSFADYAAVKAAYADYNELLIG